MATYDGNCEEMDQIYKDQQEEMKTRFYVIVKDGKELCGKHYSYSATWDAIRTQTGVNNFVV